MKKERLEFLCKEFLDAIKYCNEVAEDAGSEIFSNGAEAAENLESDLVMLSLYPVFMSRRLKQSEYARFEQLISDFIFIPDMEILCSEERLQLFSSNPFEIPKSLIAFLLRAKLDIFGAAEERKAARIEYNLSYLDFIMCHYADLMTSIPDELTQDIKDNITQCMEYCCSHISKKMDTHFVLSDEVKKIIEEGVPEE